MTTGQRSANAGGEDLVDRRLDELRHDGVLPDLDFVVEGIVERIQGLDKRFRMAMEETLEDHGLNYGEWRVLCNLHSSPDRTRTPGELSAKLWSSAGKLSPPVLTPLDDGSAVRLDFQLDPGAAHAAELRAELTRDLETVSETWLYRWTA